MEPYWSTMTSGVTVAEEDMQGVHAYFWEAPQQARFICRISCHDSNQARSQLLTIVDLVDSLTPKSEIMADFKILVGIVLHHRLAVGVALVLDNRL